MKRAGQLRRVTPMRVTRLPQRGPVRPRKALADPIGPETRALLLRRSQGRCEVCSCAEATHAHHRKLRRHGDHTIQNLLHLCHVCHTLVHSSPRAVVSYQWGHLLHRSDDPSVVPVVVPHGRFVFTAEGGKVPA